MSSPDAAGRPTMARPSPTRIAAAIVALLLTHSPALLAVQRATEKGPRPISDAERAAVELALAYLDGGASAWWDRLADGAPLQALGREAALREIEVRLGPIDGSTWELRTPGSSLGPDRAVFTVTFPSGVEETVALRLRRQANGWRLEALETTVDPILPADEPATPARSGSIPSGPDRLALAAAALAAIALASRRTRRRLAPAFAAAGLALAGLSCRTGGSPAPTAAGSALLRLAPLAPLRLALCLGGDLADATREIATATLEPGAVEVRRLWEIDELLRHGDLAAVDQRLRDVPNSSPYPLAALVRARLALARLRPGETGTAFDLAAEQRLDHDGLHLEAAEAKALTEDELGAGTEVLMLADSGSRTAESWYGAARFALVEDQLKEAGELLRVAWGLRPIPRRTLFGDPLLAALAADPQIFPLFELGSALEPRVPAAGARQPLPFPSGCAVTTCGSALRARLHGARLDLPGGARLAPESAEVVDAATWGEEDENRALARTEELRSRAAAGSAASLTRFGRQAELAAEALARRNRWRELEELTAPFVTATSPPSTALARLRALALGRLGRNDEARRLLVAVAVGELARRAPAPATLYDLAELLAKAGDYDRAMKLIRRADAQLRRPRGELRLRQLALDQVLASSFQSFRSPHFEIRFPATSGELYARKVATVLEKERQRESRWVPLVDGPRIEVNLFDIQPFFSAYGQMGVVGLFDGRVRVPFADLMSLHPELVRILSHELCHALIAAATHDRAPSWFHEGLAQHVEMGTGRVNPLPDLRRTGRAIAFPVLTPILAGFAEPQFLELAYSESAWAVHFLESRWGIAAIHRLITAYAAGRSDEEALREVTGLEPVAFDRAFWEWGATRAPGVRQLEIHRFDQELDGPIQRSSTELASSTAARPSAGEIIRRPATRESVADWHHRYSARAAAAKQLLAPILAAYEQGGSPASSDACTRLEGEIAGLRQDPSALESPERTANRPLRDAYYQLQQMAGQCRLGRHDLARESIARAFASFRSAREALAPYGVEP